MTEPTAESLLTALKTRGPQTAAQLAQRLGVTAEAVRQHTARLAEAGLVAYDDAREGVGRPRRYWRLTDEGHARFPDSHAELTLGLIEAVRAEFGAAGLERLIARRERATLSEYRAAMAGAEELRERVRRLAALREREGYMAEWHEAADGSLLLVENHCPVCAAATACQGLCRSELEVFRAVLGPDARVERTEHIPHGARRCAYRITPAPASGG